jgi:hypothetical protein
MTECTWSSTSTTRITLRVCTRTDGRVLCRRVTICSRVPFAPGSVSDAASSATSAQRTDASHSPWRRSIRQRFSRGLCTNINTECRHQGSTQTRLCLAIEVGKGRGSFAVGHGTSVALNQIVHETIAANDKKPQNRTNSTPTSTPSGVTSARPQPALCAADQVRICAVVVPFRRATIACGERGVEPPERGLEYVGTCSHPRGQGR